MIGSVETMITVIIPVHNEEQVIASCLSSLLAQSCTATVQVVIAANGCSDHSVQMCESFRAAFVAKGYEFDIVESVCSGKALALNLADCEAKYGARLYLDADVNCSPDFLEQTLPLLALDRPVYFSGEIAVSDSQSFISKAYGLIWKSLPYIRDSVVGIGCYGVNVAGRRKWKQFPEIHSDDKFVRLLFRREERKQLSAAYYWPVPEGVLTLIKVRARWIKGNREFSQKFPRLLSTDVGRQKIDLKSARTMVLNPIPALVFFLVYGAAIAVSVFGRHEMEWSRAR